MYLEHFGLREPPFNATPDPRFFYANRAYKEAFATLRYGLQARQGLVVLTGEVGTGKTTLLRRLMDETGGTTRFIFLYHTTLHPEELIDAVCAELELPVADRTHVGRIHALNQFLLAEAERGSSVALLIDEAQNLSARALEHLRLVSNLETARHKLLQIVLVGQPELQARLDDPRVRQVRQRIAVRYHLEPLPPGEVGLYIARRLRLAGGRADLFRPDAVRRIARYTEGVPRLVNIVCNAALLCAYAQDATIVTARMVDEAAGDLLLPARRRGRGASDALVVGPRARYPLAPPVHGRRVVRWPWMAVGLAAAGIALLGGAASIDRGLTLVAGALASRATDPSASPAHMAAPGPAAAVADARRDRGGRWIVVEPGATVSQIVAERYGERMLLGLDLVRELNHHIPDLDRIAAGERLWLPALTPDALARRQPDGSYHLVVDARRTTAEAERVAATLERGGYAARVSDRSVVEGLMVHRVTVEALDSVERARQAWDTSRGSGPGPALPPRPVVPRPRTRPARPPDEGD